MLLLLAKIGVCSDVAKVSVSSSEKCPSWFTFTSACERLPQRQVAELLVRVAPRLVPHPFEAALRHQRGHVVIPHACQLGLHTRRALVASLSMSSSVSFESTHSKQLFRITFVQKAPFIFLPDSRAFTKTCISVKAASRLDGSSSAAKR